MSAPILLSISTQDSLIINSITLKNVGPFDDGGLTINFGSKRKKDKANIHILVGENGSGKSTVLYGLMCLNHVPSITGLPKEFISKIGYRPIEGPTSSGYGYKKSSDVIIKTNYFEAVIGNNNFDNEHNVLPSDISQDIRSYFLEKSLLINGSQIAGQDLLVSFLNNYKIAILRSHSQGENIINSYQESLRNLIKQTQKILSELLEKKFEPEYLQEHNITRIKIDGKDVNYTGESDGKRALINILFSVFNYFSERITEAKTFDYNSHFFLLLDEIDIHLHPAWQRKILPALQKLFPNAEIFCTTHSPFVVNSVSDAWVYELSKENYKNKNDEPWKDGDGEKTLSPIKSSDGNSYELVLRRDFNISSRFGNDTQQLLNKFYECIEKNQNTDYIEKELISKNNPELDSVVAYYINNKQILQQNGKNY